jgi:diguanylate cyclase (GGDEF)-like protein
MYVEIVNMYKGIASVLTVIICLGFAEFCKAQDPYEAWLTRQNLDEYNFVFPSEINRLFYEADYDPLLTANKASIFLTNETISLDTRISLHLLLAKTGFYLKDLNLLKENVEKGLSLTDKIQYPVLYLDFLLFEVEVNKLENHPHKALILLENILNWAKNENYLQTRLGALDVKADTLNSMGNTTLALATLQEAYNLAPDIENNAAYFTKKMFRFHSINIYLKNKDYHEVYKIASEALSYGDVTWVASIKAIALTKKAEAAFYLGNIDEAFNLIEEAISSAEEPYNAYSLYRVLSLKFRFELDSNRLLAAKNTLLRLDSIDGVLTTIEDRFRRDSLWADYYITAKQTEQATTVLNAMDVAYDQLLLSPELMKYFYKLKVRGSLLNNDALKALEYTNLELELIEKMYHNNIENAVKQISLLAEQQESKRQKSALESELIIRTNETSLMKKVQLWLSIGMALMGLLLVSLFVSYRKRKLLMRKVELLAITDALTGLNNRTQGIALMKQQLEVTKRNGEAFCIALVDLDKFKYLNDTYGHKMGDKALQLFAETAKEQCRAADLLCRYGGEEFVIGFPNTDENVAQVVLARFQDKLKVASQQLGLQDYVVTFSVGVVNAAACNDLTSAIDLADKAMYMAKNQGRDKIIISSGNNNVGENVPLAVY